VSPRELSELLLRKLLGELEKDIASAQRHAERIERARGPQTDAEVDAGARAYLAVELHQYYTAAESALGRIARALDGVPPSGPRSHEDLLAQMAVAIPDVRPAVLDDDVLSGLSSLLSFRHFFRHAYAVELEWSKLLEHQAQVARVHPSLLACFEALKRHVRETIDQLGRAEGP
jgi:hypothetical protein